MVRRVARRWWVVLALVALGATLAAVSAPSSTERLRSQPGSASTELVRGTDESATSDPGRSAQELELATRVARQPEVARAAADENALTDQGLFRHDVTVSLDRDAGSVVITARAKDPDTAVAVAAAYATAAATYIGQTTGIALHPIGAPVLGPASAGRMPDDPAGRGALGAIAGLLAGLLLAATVLPTRDGRLHGRRMLERAYDTSVLAEIPRMRGRARYAGHVAFLTRPTGTVAEAYRVLRCAVLNRGRGSTEPTPRVIAVTSPSRRDGRSSVARNLAAALAESGRRVLLVDCDFGHPTVHYGVNIQPGTGLSDLLETPQPGARLAEVVQAADTPGLFILSIGTRGGREPGSLASALPHVLEVARRMVDVIVLDSEPLECAGDVVDALQNADAVLIVARTGRTRRGAARRTADLLARCGTNVAGVVLIGNTRERDARTPYLLPRPDAAAEVHTPSGDDAADGVNGVLVSR